jgi:hypothetical protein
MINQIRNTILSIISKDNRGYITPEEFNQFGRQAQLEFFEQYFYGGGVVIVTMLSNSLAIRGQPVLLNKYY